VSHRDPIYCWFKLTHPLYVVPGSFEPIANAPIRHVARVQPVDAVGHSSLIPLVLISQTNGFSSQNSSGRKRTGSMRVSHANKAPTMRL
jgi:hypothetical protein